VRDEHQRARVQAEFLRDAPKEFLPLLTAVTKTQARSCCGSGPRPFANARTQMFHFFIAERDSTGPPSSEVLAAHGRGHFARTRTRIRAPQVRFLDEMIIAKQNRATTLRSLGAPSLHGREGKQVNTLTRGPGAGAGKLETPFLDDHSGDVTSTFFAPPPDTSG
jgi:hypothetical protein